ncbi:MAG: SAM-dependent methyltransferase [Planctomycetota bacterium]
MGTGEPLIRNISDTARWVAFYRALETDRPDALFRDPHARRLAGARGESIAAAISFGNKNLWSFVARTLLFDEMIAARVAQGADLIVNLAAGLDTRPYRLALPRALQWVEVDLPEILDHKEAMLHGEQPACTLERIRLDLADLAARRELFQQLGRRGSKVVVVSEGLTIYLEEDAVAALARDLAAVPSFAHWILDLSSPGLLRMLKKKMGRHLDAAGAPLKFAPAQGADYFRAHGWQPVEVHSLLKTAARLKRLPFFLRLIARFPEPNGPPGQRPWGGVCLLAHG